MSGRSKILIESTLLYVNPNHTAYMYKAYSKLDIPKRRLSVDGPKTELDLSFLSAFLGPEPSQSNGYYPLQHAIGKQREIKVLEKCFAYTACAAPVPHFISGKTS